MIAIVIRRDNAAGDGRSGDDFGVRRFGERGRRLLPLDQRDESAPRALSSVLGQRGRRRIGMRLIAFRRRIDHSMIDATTPAPTVRPPSRMAKRSFSSMAIGTISTTSIVTLSPGITISTPSGSVTIPVTSVVRK